MDKREGGGEGRRGEERGRGRGGKWRGGEKRRRKRGGDERGENRRHYVNESGEERKDNK